MLVAQVELDGVWSVSGGMFEVAKALAQVGEKWGVKPRYGQACARILTQNGQVSGVQLESGDARSRPCDLQWRCGRISAGSNGPCSATELCQSTSSP